MSNRERWIVYPLLFLALLSSIGDKLVPQESQRFAAVECGQLALVGPDGEKLIALRSDGQNAGELVMYDAAERPILRIGSDDGGTGVVLEGWSRDHQSRFSLQALDKGAFAEWRRSIGQRICVGFSPLVSLAGLWGLDLQDQPLLEGQPTAANVAGDPPSQWGVVWPEIPAVGEPPAADDK
jgi:hypothetical protein